MAKKNSRSKNGKNGKKGKKSGGGILVLVVLAITLIILLALALLLGEKEYPISVGYEEAYSAFLGQGVNELIAPDLATDFTSGNYTLKELKASYPGFETDIDTVNDALKAREETADEVLVMVNDESITRAEVDAQLALLPEPYRLILDEEQVLEEMIDELLLMQEATARGIEVTDEEIAEERQKLMDRGNLTEETLAVNLESIGLTQESFKTMLIRQLTIQKLFSEALVLELEEGAALAYYAENLDQFETGAEVTVKHILIAAGDDAEAARNTAEDTLARYVAGEDFCELVTELTDDLGSKATCGEYTFGLGFMVPEFEAKSFELAPNETSIVDTQFGSHFILKMADHEADLQVFEDVQEDIEAFLLDQRRTELYNEFIDELHTTAEITYPDQIIIELEEDVITELDEEIMTIEEQVEEPELIEIEIVTGDPETPEEMIEEVEEVPEEVPEEPMEEVEPVEEVEEVPEEIIEEPMEEPEEELELTVTEGEPEPVEDLATCLAGKEAILYTVSWNPGSLAEADAYADLPITVLDCTGGDDCGDVTAYPSWYIEGSTKLGTITEQELAGLAGC